MMNRQISDQRWRGSYRFTGLNALRRRRITVTNLDKLTNAANVTFRVAGATSVLRAESWLHLR